MAYHFNGAVTVAELLGSTRLYQSAARVLQRMRGEEPVKPMTEDESRLMLLSGATTVGIDA